MEKNKQEKVVSFQSQFSKKITGEEKQKLI
jgi:hypothetical protein